MSATSLTTALGNASVEPCTYKLSVHAPDSFQYVVS